MGELVYARDVYGHTLVELGKKDERIVVLDADLSSSTRTSFFAKEFPQRFLNLGVAEQNMMATAAGLAACGKIVFVSTFSMFATARALDQVRNTIAYNNFNVKIVATHGGLTVGEDGASHQALEDVAFMRSIPNMRVIVPADAPEAKEAVLAAYREEGPFYIRLGRSKVASLEKREKFELGKGYILAAGEDIAIVACGIMVKEALLARQMLSAEGITPYVINIHTVKPFDKDLIVEVAKKVKGFVVCEEHSVTGGLGSSVAEALADLLPRPLRRIGVRDKFGQSGSPAQLLEAYGLKANNISEAVRSLLKWKV
ncbi:MAG: transketolase family protein [Candidatus Omnitrophica bacterium]|nr:transketolase family protein [Candidatus Omnitrophota bacterium]